MYTLPINTTKCGYLCINYLDCNLLHNGSVVQHSVGSAGSMAHLFYLTLWHEI